MRVCVCECMYLSDRQVFLILSVDLLVKLLVQLNFQVQHKPLVFHFNHRLRICICMFNTCVVVVLFGMLF